LLSKEYDTSYGAGIYSLLFHRALIFLVLCHLRPCYRLSQWFPTFFITFLPLLILELLIPPLLHKLFFHSSPITRVYENLINGYILSRLPFTCHGELIFELGRLYGLQMKNGLY